MTRSLSRTKAAFLGAIVLACLAGATWLMLGIGAREGLWRDTYQLRAGFPDVHDITEGTKVTVRGVSAGQVVAVEYPESDDPDQESLVWLRLELDERFRGRLYADATVSVHSNGLLGGNALAIDPGHPSSGPLDGDRLQAKVEPGMAEVTRKLASIAERADNLLMEIQESDGTIAKLLEDDRIYEDLRAVSAETKDLVASAKESVDAFREKLDGVEQFMRAGQETVETINQDAEAIKKLPIVRGYVEDPTSFMMRPDMTRSRQYFTSKHLFEPGTAVLHDHGRELIMHAANWTREHRVSDSEIAVVGFADPGDETLTPAYARTLTQRQCEVVVEELKKHKAHKLSWLSSRDITAKGFGFSPPPVIEKESLPPNNVQILLFLPRS